MQDIAGWLADLGLERYAGLFAEQCIDLAVLPDLTDQDLEKLGIVLGHRRKMLRAIAALDAAEPTPPQEAERRQLTVMFCDLAGSTAISAGLDPEDMREVIRLYQDACAGLAVRYDGFIAKFMGDGVLVFFGYPRAHEEDAERAVRAGLDIAAAVGKLKTPATLPLAVRIGIATGLVVVGDLVGQGSAREQAAVGDPLNLAARLQEAAAPGTVVVAASTRRLLGQSFTLRDLGHRAIKGLAETVEAWAVEGVSSSESRFEAAHASRLTGFVGREREVALLDERRRQAWGGEGQIVLIAGEAGIGKSRFAAQFVERLADEPHTRLRYHCSPYHTASALHPFIEQLKRAAGFEPEDPPAAQLDKLEALIEGAALSPASAGPLLAALLSIPFGERYPPLRLSAEQQRRQTLATLLDQLESLARRQPVLLLFEDVHWADATSLEVLNLAVERVRRLPVLALVTYRPEFESPWVGLPNATTLALGRLQRRQARAMIDWVTLGKKLPDEVVEQILGKTDGVPLFVEELTKTVLELGLLAEESGHYRLDGPLPALAIPATLHDSLMARLDRLSPVKEIAQVGAAIGREFSYALLRDVTGRDAATLDAALAQLEAAELVFRSGAPPDTRYRFKHALVQDAAHESLLKSRRQVLHRRIAEALIQGFPAVAELEPEVIASHFTQAGLAEPAVEWWSKAGEQASRRSAHVEAIAHYDKAIGLADTLSDEPAQRLRRLRLQTAYGQTLIAARGHAALETTAAFARAWQLAAQIDDPAERAAIYYGLWSGSHIRGELTSMHEVADAFLRDAERRPGTQEAVMAYRAVGANCWAEGNFPRARPHYEQALAAYDPARHDAAGAQLALAPGIATMMQFPSLLWAMGDVDRSCALVDEGFARAAQSGHLPTIAYGHMYSCVHAILRRAGAEALPRAQALVDLAREHGPPSWLAMGTCILDWARWQVGEPGVGTAEMRQAVAFYQEQGHLWYLTICPVLLAEAEAQAGDEEAALATLDATLAVTERTGQRWFQSELHRQQAEISWRRRPTDSTAAERFFTRAISVAQAQQGKSLELRAALGLARLYRTAGRDDDIPGLLAPILAALGQQQHLPEIGEAERLLQGASSGCHCE